MIWAINNNLPQGTAVIYFHLQSHGHLKMEDQKTGVKKLDLEALQLWQKISTHEEELIEEYPGLTLANLLMEKYNGKVERIEYGEPHNNQT